MLKERCPTLYSHDNTFRKDIPAVFFGVSFTNSSNVLSLRMQETNYTTV